MYLYVYIRINEGVEARATWRGLARSSNTPNLHPFSTPGPVKYCPNADRPPISTVDEGLMQCKWTSTVNKSHTKYSSFS